MPGAGDLGCADRGCCAGDRRTPADLAAYLDADSHLDGHSYAHTTTIGDDRSADGHAYASRNRTSQLVGGGPIRPDQTPGDEGASARDIKHD